MYCLFVGKELVTIEILLLDFSGGGGGGLKMLDKMAISAYIFEKSRKDPF